MAIPMDLARFDDLYLEASAKPANLFFWVNGTGGDWNTGEATGLTLPFPMRLTQMCGFRGIRLLLQKRLTSPAASLSITCNLMETINTQSLAQWARL